MINIYAARRQEQRKVVLIAHKSVKKERKVLHKSSAVLRGAFTEFIWFAFEKRGRKKLSCFGVITSQGKKALQASRNVLRLLFTFFLFIKSRAEQIESSYCVTTHSTMYVDFALFAWRSVLTTSRRFDGSLLSQSVKSSTHRRH
jgi:hypothetical protein